MRCLLSTRFLTGLLWLLLVSSSARAQSTPGTVADSLLSVLSASKPSTTRLQALIKLSTIYLNKTLNPKRDWDSALVLARQAEKLGQGLGYAKGVEEAIFLKGKIYIKRGNTGTVLEMLEPLSDTNRIKLLLEMGKHKLRPSYAQNADWDSAIMFFRRAEKLSEGIGNGKWQEESRCLTGVGYLLKGDWKKGKACFMQVVEARRRAGDKAGEIRAWLRMATTAFCDDCQENMNALARALVLCRQTGDRAREALILIEMGYKHLNGGNLKQAARNAQQALDIQKVIGFKALNRAYHALAGESVYLMPSDYGYLSNAYYFLSDLSQVKGDLNQKLYYILEVVKGMERGGMLEELDYTYFRLGNAYWELGQFDKSMAYHRQSLAISHRKGEAFVQLGLARRMTVALLKGGKAGQALLMLRDITRQNLPFTYDDKMFIAQSFGACYSALNQYQLAEKYYLEGVEWSKRTTLLVRYMAWKGISQFYVANGRYDKADPYLKRLLSASPEQIIPSHQIEVYLMCFKVDSARGNYRAAIRHYQRYKALNDSVFNERKSKQIAQLSIQYETDKKEQALRLKEKNIALLTEQSKSQQTQRNALFGGTALLLALLGLSYNRYRLKRRSNQLLQSQQQRLQAQHEELQAQQDTLQARQEEIHHQNEHLSRLLTEQDGLLRQKDALLGEKDQLLTEKEWLLKEIHHRVKNNLQIVMSLLNSQAASLKDKAAVTAIRESQHRVQTMALIHQKLYQSERVARVEMASYINDLVVYLRDAYNLLRQVRFNLLVEPIEMDVTMAVPLGLIINEALTNALKYAFPQDDSGTVTLGLHQLGETTYQLTIEDNGVGLPPGYDPSHSRSLGMTLMYGLSRQLGGELAITSSPGVTILLVFHID